MLDADYTPTGLALNALVDHTISYPQHVVLLVDANGRIVAASPRTKAVTLAQADPELARASAHSSGGTVAYAGRPGRSPLPLCPEPRGGY